MNSNNRKCFFIFLSKIYQHLTFINGKFEIYTIYTVRSWPKAICKFCIITRYWGSGEISSWRFYDRMLVGDILGAI